MGEEGGRCLYEILGVNRDATQEEIRSAYKRLALQLHPDKLISSGVTEADATATFQSLLHAYQTLSDPHQRSFYDSHRSQILFSSSTTSSSSSRRRHLLAASDLLPFFSPSAYQTKNFFKVYSDLFSDLHAQELAFARQFSIDLDTVGDAPLFGSHDSPHAHVSAFYSFWLAFSTVLDFSWADPWSAADVAAAPSRKHRRLIDDDNRKARKKARKEFNETVRALADFIKRRDKRVIEIQRRRNQEEESRREAERERRKEESRKKAERAQAYQDPEWARVAEEEGDVAAEDNEEEEGDGERRKKEGEFYCVLCGKKFKSEKQWQNHEQSKKHREKVAELRVAFEKEGGKDNDQILEEVYEEAEEGSDAGLGRDDSNVENVDELCGKFEANVGIRVEESEIRSDSGEIGAGLEEGGDSPRNDEEASVLEAMVSGHKNRKNVDERQSETASSRRDRDCDDDELNFMEYDNKKATRRNRGSNKKGGGDSKSGASRAELNGVQEEKGCDGNESDILIGKDDVGNLNESSSVRTNHESRAKSSRDGLSDKTQRPSTEPVDRKGVGQREVNSKAKGPSKGKKQKASKASGLTCETCGENFESRNKLHIHLGSTGHAVLKSR